MWDESGFWKLYCSHIKEKPKERLLRAVEQIVLEVTFGRARWSMARRQVKEVKEQKAVVTGEGENEEDSGFWVFSLGGRCWAKKARRAKGQKLLSIQCRVSWDSMC